MGGKGGTARAGGRAGCIRGEHWLRDAFKSNYPNGYGRADQGPAIRRHFFEIRTS